MPEEEEMPSSKQLLGKTVYDIKQKAIPWQFPNIIVTLRISATALGFLATACRNRSTATLQQLHVCRIVGKLGITPSFHFLLCARERLVYKDLVSLKIYLKSLLFLFLINLLGFGL